MKCDEWSGTEPQQEEEDLWDYARLQVSNDGLNSK